MPDAAQAFLDTYSGDVEIVDGGHLETYVNPNLKKWKADVRTLEGKVV